MRMIGPLDDWARLIGRQKETTGEARGDRIVPVYCMMTRRSRIEWGAAGLACCAAWWVLASPWLAGRFTIPYDAKAHFHAQLQFLATALHTGQSPFWTPHVFGGSPQIADPQSLIFSPALLLAYFSAQPTFTQLDAYVLVLLGVGGAAILMLFKDRGWHPAGGVVAALAFAFGASAAWRIQHIGQIQSYALFAITLWLLARALTRRSHPWAIATGLSAGMMIVEPNQVTLLACYVLAGYGIWHLLSAGSARAVAKDVGPVVATAAASCLLLAIVPIALTWLFVEQSNRPAMPLALAARGSLHPASLLTAVIGDLYGALDPRIEYWGPFSASWDTNELTLSQNMSQVYFGILPATAILCLGLVRGIAWDKEIRVFTAALLCILVYAIGAHTPLFVLAYNAIPGVAMFRRPADATFILGALGAIVGGYLVHRVAERSVPAATRTQRGAEVLCMSAIFAAGVAVAAREGHLADAVKPLLVACGLLSAGVLVLWALAKFARQYRTAACVLVAVFMTGDLALNNGPNESTALAAEQYEILRPNCKNETVRLLKSRLRQPPNSSRRDRVELVGLGFAWPNLGLVHGFDHVLGYNPLRLDVVDKAVGAGDTIAGWEQRQFTPLFPSYRSLLADMLGLRFIATPIPIERIDANLKPGDLIQIARTADGFIYENPRAMPRVMFVEHWMRADFGKLVADGKWPAFDPTTTVLLEEEPDWGHVVGSGARTARSLGSATLARFENTQVDIDVLAPRAGMLVMNSAWHPWWRATVDGQETPVLKANVMFRAIAVPAGRHRVRMTFEPLEGAVAELAKWTRPTGKVRVVDSGNACEILIRDPPMGAFPPSDLLCRVH